MPVRPFSQCPSAQFAASAHTVARPGKSGNGRASQHQAESWPVSSIGAPYTDDVGSLAGSAKWDRIASSARRWPRSSRVPSENGGRRLSALLGSTNRFGELAPLSTAGQPNSTRRIGLPCGVQPVGVAARTPPGRS